MRVVQPAHQLGQRRDVAHARGRQQNDVRRWPARRRDRGFGHAVAHRLLRMETTSFLSWQRRLRRVEGRRDRAISNVILLDLDAKEKSMAPGRQLYKTHVLVLVHSLACPFPILFYKYSLNPKL